MHTLAFPRVSHERARPAAGGGGHLHSNGFVIVYRRARANRKEIQLLFEKEIVATAGNSLRCVLINKNR